MWPNTKRFYEVFWDDLVSFVCEGSKDQESLCSNLENLLFLEKHRADKEKKEKQQEKKEKQAAEQRAEKAEQRLEQLAAKLRELGISPD